MENRAYEQNLQDLVSARTEQLRQALKRSYNITLEALGDALDLKDAETEGHSKRVTAFYHRDLTGNGSKFTSDFGPSHAELPLHDIGKMAIPDAILRKPGALDLFWA